MTSKNNIEKRIGALEGSEDGPGVESGLIVAYHDEESGTYYNGEGDAIDTSRADLVIAVPLMEQ